MNKKKPEAAPDAIVSQKALERRKVSREGFAWCLYLLGSNLLKMVWLSIVVFFCCATVVLAPAGLTGGYRALLVLLRGKGGLFWADFREDFADRFFKKLGLWLMMLLVPVAVGLWLYILGADASLVRWMILIGLLVSCVLQAYFFPMLAAMKLSLGDCLKNAALLLILEWKTTICFGLGLGLVAAGAYLLFPYSIPVLCFLLISCIMLLVCQQVRRIIIRRGLYLPEKNNMDRESCNSAAEGES